MGRLAEVFEGFDIDGGGCIESEELFELGTARPDTVTFETQRVCERWAGGWRLGFTLVCLFVGQLGGGWDTRRRPGPLP